MTKLMYKGHNGLTHHSGILENRDRLTKPILENKTLAQSSADQTLDEQRAEDTMPS
ncbi:hypothetical protein G9A89_006095 [Geosiphon pyriformis]|nr:hypothetical protein G9A89_006095 [Geosiphon pyriformis]